MLQDPDSLIRACATIYRRFEAADVGVLTIEDSADWVGQSGKLRLVIDRNVNAAGGDAERDRASDAAIVITDGTIAAGFASVAKQILTQPDVDLKSALEPENKRPRTPHDFYVQLYAK